MENSIINTNKKTHETTSEYAITDYEELNDLELEKVAGGGCPNIDPNTYTGPLPAHCHIEDGELICA